MRSLEEELGAELAGVHAANRYRRRRIIDARDPHSSVNVLADGRECTVFCSNDYLGLSNHDAVRDAFATAANHYGVGSGASHLVSGHHREHHALEEELAAFLGTARALVFSTGYMANLGVASALLKRGDRIVEDRLNHASLLDAGLASGARFARCAHANVQSFEHALEESSDSHAERRTLVLTDGVFSMDGDVAPLVELHDMASRHRAWLMVDDAHGFGVLGAHGRGSPEHCGLRHEDIPIYMATLGKAMGVFGAFVAGSDALIETLIQKARTYIYTTALPPAVAAAARAAVRIARSETWRRGKLQNLIARFRTGAQQLGLPLSDSPTAIQPLILGSELRALEASERLFEAGLLVTAIRPPTVPQGSARLRITLSAAHEESDVDRLLDALTCLPSIEA